MSATAARGSAAAAVQTRIPLDGRLTGRVEVVVREYPDATPPFLTLQLYRWGQPRSLTLSLRAGPVRALHAALSAFLSHLPPDPPSGVRL